MKILKWFGIVILVIILFFLIIPIFLPSDFHIERSTEIEKHVTIAFQTATDMSQRAKWDPWLEMDPKAIVEVTLLPNIIGSGYTWEGEVIGKGKITINEFIPNKLIKSEIEFIEPQSMKSDVLWSFQEDKHNTVVTWAFEGNLSYPIERWFGLFMDKSLGSQFEKGLYNFRRLVETQPDTRGRTAKIEEVDFEGILAIAIKQECPDKKIVGRMIKTFRLLLSHLKANDLDITDPPIVVYHASEMEGHTLIECALPIEKKIKGNKDIKLINLPASKTIMATHFGHYNTVKTSTEALQNYIEENEIKVVGSRFEIYVTDPMTEPDSRKWETHVYYPIK